jgi:NDP-sugar pyrophosphorylase family protein
MADAGNLSGSVHDGMWYDVGTPERLEEINRAMASRSAP